MCDENYEQVFWYPETVEEPVGDCLGVGEVAGGNTFSQEDFETLEAGLEYARRKVLIMDSEIAELETSMKFTDTCVDELIGDFNQLERECLADRETFEKTMKRFTSVILYVEGEMELVSHIEAWEGYDDVTGLTPAIRPPYCKLCRFCMEGKH